MLTDRNFAHGSSPLHASTEMRSMHTHRALGFRAALGLAVLGMSAFSTAAPTLVQSLFLGGAGNQSGFGLDVDSNGVFVCGYNHDLNSIAAKYSNPPSNSPVWTVSWPFLNSAPKMEAFFGVADTPAGPCFAGWSYSQTTDNIGDKEGKPVLVKFPPSGGTGNQVGGADWIQKPQFFPSYQGYEYFHANVCAFESGTPYIYAAGAAQTNGANQTAILTKTTLDGQEIWRAALSDEGFSSYSQCFGVITLGGYVYVSGYVQTGGGTEDLALWKYDAAGNQVHMSTVHSAGHNIVGEGLCTDGANIYVAGYEDNGANGGDDFVACKFDGEGTNLWTQTWGGAGDDRAYGAAFCLGRLFLAGSTSSYGNGGLDASLTEVKASDGTRLSQEYFGGSLDDEAMSIKSYGVYLYLVGHSFSFASQQGNSVGEDDIMLLRYVVPPSPTASHLH